MLGAVAHRPRGVPELFEVATPLDAIVESVTDPYVLGDPVRDGDDGQIVDFIVTAANQAATADVGLSHRALVGGRASTLFPGDFGRRLISMVAEVLETGAPLSIDEYPYPSRRARGALHRYDVRASAVGDRLVFTWRDVTDRFEERIRFQAMIANSADVVFLVRDGLVEWVSPGIADLLGWDPADVVGTPVDQVVHPGDRAQLAGVRADDATGGLARLRMRYLRRGGGFVWCEARAAEVHEMEGTVVVVSLREETAAMEAEEARLRSDEQYRLIAQNTSDIVYTTDRMYRFNRVSPSVEAILGWTPDELLGRPTSALHDPGDREQVADLRAQIFGSDPVPVQHRLRYRTKSGGFRWMAMSAHPVPDDPDHRLGVIVALRDIQDEVLERRATDTLTAGNALLAVADDEAVLLGSMCETAVQVGGYAFAWYGRSVRHADDSGTESRIDPVASSAGLRAYLDGMQIHVDGGPLADGPTGRAARTHATCVEQGIADDPAYAPWRTRALAFGFRSSASLVVRVDGRPDGVLTVYATEPEAFDDHAVAVLEDLTRTLGFGLERVRDRADLRQAFASSIDLVAAVVESRDPYTAGHQALVSELARAVGAELGLDEHRLDGLAFAARIHDVGKIGVPIDILCRPGVLTPEELAVVRRHATVGWEIAGHFAWPWPVADIVHQHHEQFDGSGYPQGLRGEEILLEARIVSVADCYQAVASRRPYREALGEDVAYRTILEGSGTQFDPDVVDAFVTVLADGFTFSGPGPGQA